MNRWQNEDTAAVVVILNAPHCVVQARLIELLIKITTARG